MTLKTTLLIPTLNEVEGMRVVMPNIRREWVDQIIIVDGGSRDGTVEWARDHGYFVHVQEKPGLRQAYNEVINLIEGDVLITLSPDGNTVVEDIPRLMAKMREGYDMVIGSRYLGPAKSQDDTWLTGFGNWVFTHTINLLHGSKYTDAMVIFRAYKTRLISDLELDKEESHSTPEKLFSTHISWEPLLSVRAAKRKLKLGEIPSNEPPRIGGKAKLQIWRWGAAYMFQVIRELFVWR